MTKRYTQEEVSTKFTEQGFTLLEKYIDSKTKIKTQCRCGKIFYSRSIDILRGHTKSCGHCNDPKIGETFGKLTVIKTKSGNTHGCSVKCLCGCGKETKWLFLAYILNGNNISCGHCNDPKIGDKFNKLTVINIKKSNGGGCSIKCKCDCGAETKWNHSNVITTNKIKSCGHCNDPKVGNKFGRLTITKVKSNNHGCQVKCNCDCKKETKWYPASRITNGDITSCGNCELKINGIKTSNIALQLHNIIEDIIGQKCKHNYYIARYCCDIVSLELKLVIEYDGYYWHRIFQDTRDKDKKKAEKIIKAGYKLFVIQSSGDDLPSKEELEKGIERLKNGEKIYTLTMNSWIEKENLNS